ncbi:GNAT family N-acetyltransferase [Alteribacter populi]|uniref:GNAT family N-acetyltransferase n=1 Tax=Alteribacter populi TaxID=2011011 RepID=UPI0012FE2A64|nr:GNAT family protein [Alteribacter populi]
MGHIRLQGLSEELADELLNFEVNNRTFFEEVIPGRGDDFYQSSQFLENLKSLVLESTAGKCYMYVVKNSSGEIVGRINLVDVQETNDGLKVAEMGYRIGEAHKGKGYATAAIKLAVEEAINQNIDLLIATTSTDNIGSQVVLVKNGFHEAGVLKESLEFRGQWIDGIRYERVLR